MLPAIDIEEVALGILRDARRFKSIHMENMALHPPSSYNGWGVALTFSTYLENVAQEVKSASLRMQIQCNMTSIEAELASKNEGAEVRQ